MNTGKLTWCFTLIGILFITGFAAAQQTSPIAGGLNMSEMNFGPVPGLPTCATVSVQNGDPSKGPSILLAKLEAGCFFPWHWHTPNEHVMMISGTSHIEMKEGKPITLQAGGYAMFPSKHVHSFRCTDNCTLYVYSDGAFDMNYVDANGKALTPEDALKAVGETAATAPK